MVTIENGKVIETKSGPESKYHIGLADRWIQLRGQGKTVTQAMMLCDIRSWDTYKKWQTLHPEFKEAVEFGKIAAQAYWEEVGNKGIMGEFEKFNAPTYIFKMCNMFSDQYKQSNNGVNVQVNNNTITPYKDLTDEQLHQKALELSKKILLTSDKTLTEEINTQEIIQ